MDDEIADFSDSLVKRRRKGYGGGAYVLELIGTDFGQPETPEQKFNRLHLEINELSEQLQAIKVKHRAYSLIVFFLSNSDVRYFKCVIILISVRLQKAIFTSFSRLCR